MSGLTSLNMMDMVLLSRLGGESGAGFLEEVRK